MKGSSAVTGLSGGLAGFDGVTNATAQLKLPDVAGLGVSRDVSPRLKLLGSFNWYGWQKFNDIDVALATGAHGVTPESYRNSVSASLGGEWKQTDRLTVRGGLMFDETPTTSPARSTRTTGQQPLLDLRRRRIRALQESHAGRRLQPCFHARRRDQPVQAVLRGRRRLDRECQRIHEQSHRHRVPAGGREILTETRRKQFKWR